MIVDGPELIKKQLAATESHEVAFAAGVRTTLTPARFVPDLTGESNTVSLDGEWRVSRWPFRKDESTLLSSKTSDASWPTVIQPGKVLYADPEAEAEPIKNWNRVTLDHINDKDGAIVRRRVRIPRDWKNKRIYLRFDSIYPAGRVYLNGKLLGEHLSGLTPVEYDVTGKVKAGQEVLVAVRLLRKHKFVKMDMVRHSCEFAGLAQSACFHATGQCQIADYQLIPELNSSLNLGTVSGTVDIRNHAAKSVQGKLKASITDASGKIVARFSSSVKADKGATVEIPVKLTAKAPLLWNDEFPNLYRVTLALAVRGQPEQIVSYHTGFRRFDLSPRGARLNGSPVKFRGVNHLTFHPQHGMHTPEDWLRRNLRMMKRANVNAIRTHYLGPRCLAELCDELGIYLLQELPIDWGTDYIHDPEWVGPALFRMEGGIRRDRHHPSVMVWSIGNENMPNTAAVAADGWNHMRIFEKFAKTLDPSRPTMFPPPGPANKIKGILELRVGDIADTHYCFTFIREFNETGKCENPVSWEANMETCTRADALKRGWKGVWFSSEYGIFNLIPDLPNAPYNSIISDLQEDLISGKSTMQTFVDRLRYEWGYMRNDPSCLGGAYFPWMCAGSGKGDEGNPWGWVRWAEDADWGVMCADLTPKPYFWALRALFSPVWFPERLTWKKGEKAVRFSVTNQYNSIDLKDCILRTQITSGGPYMGMLRRFKDIKMTCAPGQTTEITIPIWNNDVLTALDRGTHALCRMALLDPRGFRTLTHDLLIIPESLGGAEARTMPIGPDAVL